MNQTQRFSFQLYKSDQNLSTNKQLYFGRKIDITELSNYSRMLKKKLDEKAKLKSDNIIKTVEDEFLYELRESQEKLKIDNKNFSTFINLIAGESQDINIESFFDIFKLSKHFDIKNLIEYLKKTCIQIEDTKTIYLILHKGEICKEEEQLFLEFLECGKMDQKLSERIEECFKKSFLTNFPVSAIFRIFRKCTDKALIPPNDLYQFVIKSIETKLSLLPFLDIFHLSYGNKQSVFKYLLKMENEINQIKTENEELKTNDSDQRINELTAKIKSLETENEKLKKNEQRNLQNDKPNQGINDFNTKIKSLEIGNKQSNLQNDKLNQRINELTEKIKSLESENETLKKNEQRNLEIDKLSNQINELTAKIKSLETENENLKRNKQSNQQNDKPNQGINDSNTKIKSLETEIQQINLQIDKSNQRINELTEKIKSLETENEKLKKNEQRNLQIDKSNQRINELTEKIKSLESENETLKKNEQRNLEIDKLSSQINELTAKIKSLETKNKQTNLQIDKSNQIINDLTTKIKSLETENAKLKKNEQIKPSLETAKFENHNQTEKVQKSIGSTDHLDNPPHLSPINKKRIQIFNENKAIVAKGSYQPNYSKPIDIKQDLDYSIQHTRTILSDHQPTLEPTKKRFGKASIYDKIEVTRETTFAAAIRMKKDYSKKVCVLNFASATKPGGGVLNGRNAQEESLARQSTLYFSLVEQKEFYEHNKNDYSPFGNDDMIYSPNVLIIRDDNNVLIKPIKVSVISAVAVNCSELNQTKNQSQNVFDIMKKRCRRILDICVDKGNDVIVLGAFGCGVFENSPKMISQIFKEILIDDFYGMNFKRIIFAIKTKPNQSNEMIDAFENALLKK
ncbi:hypothetical protein M9Y10_032420 [Tritrichomonas musculus]|uniref:Microbial-type PARG catalytic domain-containing protein n=1 Tax=Tritrichomonas musculus TaxID=1915356 RepID=A0ABR2GYE9_9EUKA